MFLGRGGRGGGRGWGDFGGWGGCGGWLFVFVGKKMWFDDWINILMIR